MGQILKNGIPYGGAGGGSEYTAGDGIVIENDEISTNNMPVEDMSEVVSPLPSVMSRRFKYSTEEQVVGEWIDGKPIYQKTIDCGTLANNNSKQVAHNISNLDIVCELFGAATNSDHTAKPIPHAHDVNISAQIQLEITSTNICLYNRGSNYSGYNAYVTLRYTKTTD